VREAEGRYEEKMKIRARMCEGDVSGGEGA
jgi:hypothetical protein